MKIFASGSCRLVTTIGRGSDNVIPIHSMFYNFSGINFLGKLHNTKQHIQFIQYLKDEIVIPEDILPKFLTSYNTFSLGCNCEDLSLIPSKKESIRNQFGECEWYLFEVCSLKLYKKDGFQVQFEHTNEYTCEIQTEEDLLEDLQKIREIIPREKKILFQVHFRPNIMYKNPSMAIEKREIIFRVINDFCKKTENTFVYDPSVILNDGKYVVYDGAHFNEEGHLKSFEYIYENFLSKYGSKNSLSS